jgi:hypothetical protein
MFSFEKAETNVEWFAEEWGQSVPESEEYGIGSFVFRGKEGNLLLDDL